MFMLKYGHLLSDRIKLQISFAMIGLLMISMTFVADIQPVDSLKVDKFYEGNYWSCFAMLVLMGIFNAFVSSTIFGKAAILPGKYMGLLSVG